MYSTRSFRVTPRIALSDLDTILRVRFASTCNKRQQSADLLEVSKS